MKHFLQTFLLLICVMGAMVSVKAQIVLSEDFESGSIGASWTQEQVSGTTSWTVPTSISFPSSGACEGSRSALFKVLSTGPTTKLITPEMDLSGIAAPQLTFTHAQVSWSSDIDELYIYYRVSATDAWVELASYTSEFSTCTEETILLPNPSATYQIAFEAVSNLGRGVVLDQIAVGAAPTCFRPTVLAVGALTTISAELSWTNGGGENAWNIEYGTAGFTQGNGTIVDVTENPYSLEGLSANTNYDFYVQADCGGGDVSEWSLVETFTTPCDAYTISESQPYQENFDSYTSGFGYFPDCWSFINASDNSSTYPQAYVYASTVYAVNLNCLYFKSSSTTPVYAVLPNISNNIENLVLSFVYKNEGTGGSNGTLSVGVMTDPSDAATFTEVYSCAQTTTRTPITINNFGTNTGVQYIAFKYIGAGTINNYYLGIDNVVVSQRSSEKEILTFSLPEATQPTVIDAENHTVTAEISFSADITAQTPTITVSDFATISPLSGVAQDFTDPVVYTVTAEDASTQEWTVTVTQAVSASSENDIVAFTFAHQIGDAVIDINNHTVNASAEWDYNLTSIAPTITISDFATITPLSGVAQDFNAPIVYTVTAEDATEQPWTVSIINDTTACPNPNDATMQVELDPTAITFTWAPVYLENSYNAKISTVAIDPANASGDIFDQIVNNTTLTINGLTPNTTYYCYLQSNCGTTEWIEASFTTPCEPLSIPYFEGFESGYTHNTVVGGCISQESVAGDQSWMANTSYTDFNRTPRTGSWNAFLRYNNTDWMFVPVALEAGQSYDFSMYARQDVTSGCNMLVSYGSAPNAAAMTNPIVAQTNITSGNYQELSGSFTPATTGTYYVGINATLTYDPYYVSIDDITIDFSPTCMKPADVHTNVIMPTSAEIGWTANSGETSWLVKLNGVDTLVTDNPATLLNLTGNTDYTVQVRAICSETDSSQWTSTVAFTTPCEAYTTLPYMEGFEGTYPTSCWNMYYANPSYPAGNAMSHSSSQAYEGTKSFRFSSYNTGSPYDEYLISPEFNVEDAYIVSFQYRKSDSYGDDSFRFGYSSNSNDVNSSDFTWGATVTDASPTAWNEYTITVPSGTKYFAINYNVTSSEYYLYIDNVLVRNLSSDNDILTFTLPDAAQATVIDVDNHTVTAEISISADITAQTPTITVSDFATISPLSGVVQDFTAPIVYTVTAEDASTQEWTVTVTQAVSASSANDIVAFTFAHQIGDAVIDTNNHTVNASAEWDYSLTAIAPTITVSDLATITPLSGVAQDFTAPVVYIVTAEDLTEQTWTVSIINDTTACPNPDGATMEMNIGATTATFTWSPIYLENSYNAKISTVAIDPANTTGDVFDQIVNDTTLTINGLNPNTPYYCYLQSNCGTTEWLEGSFTTECLPYTIPYFEGFESGYTHNAVVGGCISQESIAGNYSWSANTSYTDYNRTPRTGSWNAFLRYSNTDWMFVPVALEAGQSYDFSMYARQNVTSGCNMLVSYGSAPNAAAMTNPIVAQTNITSGNYQELSGSFTPATTGTYYVGINATLTSAPWYVSIDDITIDFSPTCVRPTDLHTNLIMPTSAEIGWTAINGETSWLVKVNGVDTLVTDNPATLLNLTGNTDYTVQVRAICSETDSSQWTNPISFYTALCIPAPTSIDGQGITNVTFGQTQIVNNNTHPTAAPYYGDYTAQVGDGQQGTPVTVNITYATGQTYGTPIWVNWNNDCEFTDDELVYWGTSTDVEPTTLTASFTIPLGTPLGNYSMRIGGSDYQFDNADNLDPCLSTSWTIYEDYTLQVVEAPACLPVVDVEINNITAHEAEVSWTEQGSAVNWIILLNDSSIVVTENPYLLENISAYTDYTISVQAVCSETDSSDWSPTVAFRTECEALTTFPWTEDFESVTTPALPICWSYINNNEDGDYWKTFTSYGVNSSKAAGIYTDINNGNNDDYLVLPQFTLTGNQRLIYSVRAYSTGEPNDYRVVLSTTGSDPTDFTNVLMPLTQVDYTTMTEIDPIDLSAYSGDVYIAIHIPAGGLDGWYIYFDNFIVEDIPTCLKPTDVDTNLVMPTYAEIGWTANSGETSWLVKVNGVDTLVTDNPATLLNLTANTDYTVQVQAICSETDSSQWSNPISFYTGFCIPAPTSIDGDGITNVTFGQTQIVNNNTHPTAAPYYGDYTAQVGDGQQGTPVTVNITYATGQTYGTPIWVNWNNDCEFTDDELVYWGTSTDVEPTTLTASFTIPLGTPLGNYSMRIGGSDYQFDNADNLDPCLSTSWTIYEDYTLQVVEAPACLPVVDVEINNITAHEAEVSWTEQGSAVNWIILLNDSSIVVTENPYLLENISANTDYTVSVQAVCSETDSSVWSTIVAFTTACDAYTILPYMEGFEGTYPTSCWSMYYANTSYPIGNAMSHSNSQAYEGTNSFRFSSYSQGSPYDEYLISPEFNVEDAYLVSFQYRKSNSSGDDSFRFGYSSNSNDVNSSDFTWGATVTDASPTAWNEYTITVPSGTKYFAINYNVTSSEYYLYIDNVLVRNLSSDNDILTFTLPEATQPSVIDAENHTVTTEISFSADITAQTPTITVSDYATISPLSGVVQDFTAPIVYTVTAEDASTQEWTVTVTQAVSASSANDIVAFTFAHQIGDAVIDTNNHTVNASAEWDYSLTAIAPTITISELATITPLSGVVQDFTAPVVYTVTAEDLTEQTWTVSIINDTTACPNPNEATMQVEIDTTAITFTWSPVYMENSYNAKISTVAIDPAIAAGDVFDQIVNDTTLTINGLTPNTTYYCYLQSNCGTTEWIEGLFTTECLPYTIPYFEGFESGYTHNTDVGGCISQESVAGSYSWTANASFTTYNRTPRTGGWNAILQHSNTDWMFIPVTLEAGESYYFTMYARQDVTSGCTMLVSYGSAPNAAAMTNPIVAATNITNGNYQELSGSFTPATTDTYYVGINAALTISPWYVSIDDISLDFTPTCMKPTDVHTNLIMPTYAEIGWTANSGETSWLVKVNGVDTLVTDNPATLLNLTANTDYTVQVRAICSETDTSASSNPTSFMTLCEVLTITDNTPFEDGFENDFGCWSQVYDVATQDWIITNSTTQIQPYEGSSFAAFGAESFGGDATKLISPLLDITGVTNPFVKFAHTQPAWGGDQNQLIVYYRASETDAWTELVSYTNNITAWALDSVQLPHASATYQVAFKGIDVYGHEVSVDAVFVGNISIPIPACETPTNVTVVPDSNFAVVSWTATEETSWNIEYGPAGFTQGAGTMINDVTTNPYTITNLTPETPYDVYVQAICSEDSITDWSAVQSFTTTTVGIAEYEGLNVSLYPNPANSEINVQLSASLHNGQIAIYDVYGKLLKQVAVEGNLTTINIQNMASGVYFVRILDGNNILQTMKVVKK